VALVLAGGDTLFDYRGYRDAVLARAAELGLDPVLLGPVPHEELPSLVAAASVFAFPSTKEGFGLAAMEALAARVPLVLRDLPVLREVFDGAARFAAPALGPDETASPVSAAGALAEAVAAALGPTDPILTMRGVKLAERHTWSAAAAAHLRFYRERFGP
jgi:glycosyltransferase involved in cell wall biosynthesis